MERDGHSEPAPPASPAQHHWPRRWVVGLRLSLVAYSILTVILTAAVVHIPWLYISHQNIRELAGQINDEIDKGLTGQVEDLFGSAAAAQRMLRDVLQDGLVDVEDKPSREKLFFAVMQANPDFSWVSFGKPNGDLYGIQRRDDINLRAEQSRYDPATKVATRSIDYYVNGGDVVHYYQTKIETNDYFAPDRDWYKRAAASDGPIWTDLYLFATSGRPGLNTAVRVMRDGRLLGCLTIAIALERLSDYLMKLDISRRGAVFIVDPAGRLIALRDLNSPSALPAKDAAYLQPVAQSSQPMLRLATAAMAANGLSFTDLGANPQLLFDSPELGGHYFVSLRPAGHQGWILGTVLPEKEFMAQIDSNQSRLAVALLIALVLVGCAAIVTSRVLFVTPLRRICAQIADVANFDLAAVTRVPTRIREIDALSLGLVRMSHGLASFKKYLPTELVRSLLARGMVAELGGEKRMMTILFLDIEGFTTYSERFGHRLLPQLARFFDEMSAAIAATGGTIDKYIGDCIMAFWGAPAHNDNHAVDACRSALACLGRIEELRAEWQLSGQPDFRIRIGLNTGRVIVGNIGSSERLNYTAIGDPVNLAKRLEDLNRLYGTRLIVGHTTYSHGKYEFVFRRLDTVTVRGRDEPEKIYEVLAEASGAADEETYAWVRLFESGLAHFEAKDWQGALELFRKVTEIRGDDPPSAYFIERCERRLAPEVLRAVPGSTHAAAE